MNITSTTTSAFCQLMSWTRTTPGWCKALSCCSNSEQHQVEELHMKRLFGPCWVLYGLASKKVVLFCWVAPLCIQVSHIEQQTEWHSVWGSSALCSYLSVQPSSLEPQGCKVTCTFIWHPKLFAEQSSYNCGNRVDQWHCQTLRITFVIAHQVNWLKGKAVCVDPSLAVYAGSSDRPDLFYLAGILHLTGQLVTDNKQLVLVQCLSMLLSTM